MADKMFSSTEVGKFRDARFKIIKEYLKDGSLVVILDVLGWKIERAGNSERKFITGAKTDKAMAEIMKGKK